MGYNQPGYRWYVVDVQKLCIESGWEHFADANDRARDMVDEGAAPGAVKVMTKPRVGGLVLDPRDDANWTPKRGNPGGNPAENQRRGRTGASALRTDTTACTKFSTSKARPGGERCC